MTHATTSCCSFWFWSFLQIPCPVLTGEEGDVEDATEAWGPGLEVADIPRASIPLVRLAMCAV